MLFRSLGATLTSDFAATATIGFVQGTLRPLGGQANQLTGVFGMGRLDDLSSAVLTGQADMHLELSGGFSGLAKFPSIGTDFTLGWKIDSSNPTVDAPKVSFSGVNLDLGEFLGSLLDPILSDINSIVGG